MARKHLLISAVVAAVLAGASGARADLIGDTVTSSFIAPDLGDINNDINVDSSTTTSPPIGSAGTSFVDAYSDSTIDVGKDLNHSEIVITSLVAGAFCFGPQCPTADAFDGFEFIFSGPNVINGVSVDPASAADFLPASPLTFTPASQDILVDLTNVSPGVNDQLILDLTFAGGTGTGTGPTGVPEPASLTLLISALVGVGAASRRRNRVDQNT